MCAQYEPVVRALAKKHHEHLYDIEPMTAGTRELWLNMKTGSFTILSHIGPLACVEKSGKLDPARLQEMHREWMT